ncbi:HET-C-related protein [Nitrosomonas sp.]|uniref:HET-C-related protein n=1 Tax=Nitrosomonas sp. TaxID=42353 RepID=UPI00260A4FDF|nr:HET-C-related protein [Nitrosomonas sp.]
MNTHGHESVAEAAGLPLLKAAFSQTMENPRLNAFYLGNWIADLSQLIDPVAATTAADTIKNYIEDITDWAINGIWASNGIVILNNRLIPLDELFLYDSIIRKQREKLLTAVNEFFNFIIQPDPVNGTSPWYKAVQPGILLKGYFKFVHPKSDGQPLRMDLEAYLKILETLYQQYYPHEHLDRPTHPEPLEGVPGGGATQYDDRRATGPRTGNQSQSPDLYIYLRDFLEIIAGRLTKLDIDWASRYLATSGISDSDIGWNLGLAELGQALHGLEDFFAHSNFIEHAALVMGDKYLPKSYQFDESRFLKRLKRYNFQQIPDDWTVNAEEDYVVTGYFDFKDTKISLGHLLIEGLPLLPRDVTRDIRSAHDYIVDIEGSDAAILDKFDKLVSDFLEIIDDSGKLNRDNKENSVVEAILWFIENTPLDTLNSVDKFIEKVKSPSVNVDDFSKLFERMPLFQEIQQISPKYIRPEYAALLFKYFFDFIRGVTNTVRGGRTGISIYKSVKEIVELLAAPEIWIIKQLPEKLAKLLLQYEMHYSIEAKFNAMGAERIGCHSLIAKDHGSEVLYQEMKNCATAAHYYVVQTILRRADPNYANRPESQQWVNWLELIEHLTNHPAANVVCAIPKDVPVEIIHTITSEEKARGLEQLLKDLLVIYQPRTLKPTGLPFSEKSILHGNCSVKLKRYNWVPLAENIVASILPPPISVPLRLRRLIIPYIKFTVNVCDPTAVSPRWYMPIMQSDPNGWEIIKTQGVLHTIKYHINRQEALEQISHSDSLREKWKNHYRPKVKEGSGQ